MFAHIIEPNLAVSPAYATREVVTKDGRRIVGLPVYTSPDGTILTVGPGQTVRIRSEEFVSNKPSLKSLMPAGLLDGLSDEALADLCGYLREAK